MSEDTSRADCDHAEVERHRMQIDALILTVNGLDRDLDALGQVVNRHLVEPHQYQADVACLRTLLRAIEARVTALEEGRQRPPEGGKHAPS